jgi:hypothetical protein
VILQSPWSAIALKLISKTTAYQKDMFATERLNFTCIILTILYNTNNLYLSKISSTYAENC